MRPVAHFENITGPVPGEVIGQAQHAEADEIGAHHFVGVLCARTVFSARGSLARDVRAWHLCDMLIACFAPSPGNVLQHGIGGANISDQRSHHGPELVGEDRRE